MAREAIPLPAGGPPPAIDYSSVFNALEIAIIVIDGSDSVSLANAAAEHILGASQSSLAGRPLAETVPGAGILVDLAARVRESGAPVVDHAITLRPRHGAQPILVDAVASPMSDGGEFAAVTLYERTVSSQMERQLGYRGTARSIAGMAAVLAHEIKNPLSGIRGAAQLLGDTSSDEDRPLTELIRSEVDRICALVDRMSAFSDGKPVERAAVNIHMVLDHVKRLAETGFGAGVTFAEAYDPSLPPVAGERDLLVQALLNLVKNAAEAVPDDGGRVTLRTRYQPGVRVTLSGEGAPVHLPLVVEIADNGPGIPEELTENLFDPFVTTKPHGTGLGLTLAAKIVSDHGGIMDFERRDGETVFRVLLPVFREGEPGEGRDDG